MFVVRREPGESRRCGKGWDVGQEITRNVMNESDLARSEGKCSGFFKLMMLPGVRRW